MIIMQPLQREFEVRLPIGYTDDNGKVHRWAVLRKMRGHEESLLYDTALTGPRLVTELIRSCLVSLGTLISVDTETVTQLFSADRNYLLLELRRITLGDKLRTSYRCPGCNATVVFIDDLSRLEIRRLEDNQVPADISLVLEDGYVDRQGVLHNTIMLRLPRGADEEFVAPMAEKDPLKAEDALLLRCIQSFGTLQKSVLEAYGVKILRDLTLGDRHLLQQALNEQTAGVNFLRPLTCGHCGIGFSGVMDISHFFVPG